MNQASVKSLVVPVLPAIGRFSRRARAAVPRSTTPRSSEVTMKAVSARSASLARGVACSTTLPSRSVMRSIRNGFMRRPWLAKVA